MRGSVGRENGRDFWIGYGADAVAMARACAHKARENNRWDIAEAWDRCAEVHAADRFKPLKRYLPPGIVKWERHSRGFF